MNNTEGILIASGSSPAPLRLLGPLLLAHYFSVLDIALLLRDEPKQPGVLYAYPPIDIASCYLHGGICPSV